MREHFFTPRLRFKCYDEVNAWLMDKCIAWTKAHGHPERPDQTIWEVFEEERPKLIPYRSRFDGFHAIASFGVEDLPRPVRQQQILRKRQRGRPPRRHSRLRRARRDPPGRAHRGGTSTPAMGAAQPYTIRGITYRSWRAKPGALRNGAPFKDWVLPTALERVRRKLAGPRRRPSDGQDPRRGAERRAARRWKPPALRRCPRASIRPTSSSTSSRVSAIRGQRRQS